MDTWTLQKGYPIVTATRSGNQVRVKQNWFLLNPLNSVQKTDLYNRSRWFIPFTYTTKEQLNWSFESKPSWFRPEQQECKLRDRPQTKNRLKIS